MNNYMQEWLCSSLLCIITSEWEKFILNLKNVVVHSWNDYVNDNYKCKRVSFSHKCKQGLAMSVLKN